jgi:hypothetical protein
MTDDIHTTLGMLTQAVVTLTSEVKLLRAKVECIEAKMNRGKGFMYGMVFAAGGLGAGLFSAVSKVLG